MSGSVKKSGCKSTTSGGWFTCSKCGKRFPRSASAKHVDGGCSEELYPRIEGHGQLGQGQGHRQDVATFALLVNATTTSKIQNLPFIKCSRLSSSTIFVPEELIRESGFTTFSWVRVTFVPQSVEERHDGELATSTPPVALRVWPIPDSISSSSASGNVMMTKDGFLANHIVPGDGLVVKIQSLCSGAGPFPVILPASTIQLQINDVETDLDQSTFEPERFIRSFKTWFRGRLITSGNSLRIRYYAEVIPFTVVKLGASEESDPRSEVLDQLGKEMKELSIKEQYLEITDNTEVEVSFKSGIGQTSSPENMGRDAIRLEDVGGLDPVIKELVATINFIFKSELNVAKGVLLYGHSGTGKTHLIHSLCNHFKLKPIIFNEFATSSGTRGARPSFDANVSNSISKVFQVALSKSPSAILLENLDTLAPGKGSGSNSEQRSSNFAQSLISLIPSLSTSSKSKIIIFATATDPDGVDSFLRSPQIFGKEFELPVPSRREREDILQKMLTKITHDLSKTQINDIAASTHGFVGADLHGLCTQAVQASVERCNSTFGKEKLSDFRVTMEDMVPCLKSVKPSAIKSILVDVPNVRWTDIGGQDELKFKLKQAIEWPLKHPEAFQRLGITPPKGVLMYGPPGCSKTMIAKAIATESGLNFISVKGSELFSKWVGESEKAVRDVFKKARQVSPCVVFFDEIDSLGGERGATSGSSNVHERVLAQLLVELDGIEPLKDVTIVAATNRPDIIDQALLRPGRLDRIIYVPLPDLKTRREILRIQCLKMPMDSSVDIEVIVTSTEGYSGAELTALCHEAAMKSLEEDITSQSILQRHFLQALEIVKPRIDRKQIEFYDNYSNAHKR